MSILQIRILAMLPHEGALDVRGLPWVVIYVIIKSRGSVEELKGRTSSQLPLMNQSVSTVRKDNDQRVVYAVNLCSLIMKVAYANLAIVPCCCMKKGDIAVGLGDEIWFVNKSSILNKITHSIRGFK